MNARKRLTILLALTLNSMVVVALLMDTRQEFGLLVGKAAVALLAVVFSYPLPYVISSLFYRPTPDGFKINLKPRSSCLNQIPCLLLIFSLLANEYYDGLNVEDEDTNGENDDNGKTDQDEDNNRDLDENEEEDEKKNAVDAKGLIVNTAATTVGSQVAMSRNDMQKNSAVRSSSPQNYESCMNLLGHSIDSKNTKNEGKWASKRTYSILVETHKRDINKPSMILNFSTRFKFIENQTWSMWDAFAFTVVFVFAIGAIFFISVLSWRMQKKTAFATVRYTLVTFGQDFAMRILTTAFIEFIIIGPCALGYSTYISRENDDNSDAKKMMTSVESVCVLTLPSDVETCKIDRSLRVTEVIQSGIGLKVGWYIKSIEGRQVHSYGRFRRVLRRIVALKSEFQIELSNVSLSSTASKSGLGADTISCRLDSENAQISLINKDKDEKIEFITDMPGTVNSDKPLALLDSSNHSEKSAHTPIFYEGERIFNHDSGCCSLELDKRLSDRLLQSASREPSTFSQLEREDVKVKSGEDSDSTTFSQLEREPDVSDEPLIITAKFNSLSEAAFQMHPKRNSVLSVRPGGGADLHGIKRAMAIKSINGTEVSEDPMQMRISLRTCDRLNIAVTIVFVIPNTDTSFDTFPSDDEINYNQKSTLKEEKLPTTRGNGTTLKGISLATKSIYERGARLQASSMKLSREIRKKTEKFRGKPKTRIKKKKKVKSPTSNSNMPSVFRRLSMATNATKKRKGIERAH